MGLYDKPQVVNPTRRSQSNTIDGWVDQTAQAMPALNPAANPAAVSGPTTLPAPLPPQAGQMAHAAIQRHMGGDPFKGQQGVGPTGVMPMVPKVHGIEQPDQLPTGVMPMNPNNNDKVQGTPPNIGSQHANNLAAWQAYRPQMQDWRASRPDTQGMTDEQKLAAVQGWFGSRPASPFRHHQPLGPQPAAPTWPGSRDRPVTQVAPVPGFAATPNPIPGVNY